MFEQHIAVCGPCHAYLRQMRETIDHLVSMHGTRKGLDKLLAAGRCCIESYTGTLLEDSRAIEVPLFMVWGDHDGLVPSKHAYEFGRVHPRAHPRAHRRVHPTDRPVPLYFLLRL